MNSSLVIARDALTIFSSRNASLRRNMSKFCDVIIFLSSFNSKSSFNN